MGATRNRAAVTGLIVTTGLASIPFLALGVYTLIRMPVQLWLVGALYVAAVFLASRPIKIHPDAALSPSDIPITPGALLLPPGSVPPLPARLPKAPLPPQRP